MCGNVVTLEPPETFMSFQLNDLICICLTPTACQYPTKPGRYKQGEQILLTTVLTWYSTCLSSFASFLVKSIVLEKLIV